MGITRNGSPAGADHGEPASANELQSNTWVSIRLRLWRWRYSDRTTSKKPPPRLRRDLLRHDQRMQTCPQKVKLTVGRPICAMPPLWHCPQPRESPQERQGLCRFKVQAGASYSMRINIRLDRPVRKTKGCSAKLHAYKATASRAHHG